MKLAVATRPLVESLSLVARAVSSKGINQILANVLIRTDAQGLWLVGTDLEVTTIARVPAQVETPGEVTIPARLFLDVVSNLPTGEEDRVTFDLPGTGLPGIELRCGTELKYDLQIQGTEEYPPVPAVEKGDFPNFTIDAAGLQQHLKRVEIAIASEEANAVHRSVCLNFNNGELILAATDTKRLAMTKFGRLEYPPEFQRQFLMPGKAVHELVKLLDAGGQVRVGLFNEQLVFATAGVTLLTRLYEGKFPDHNRVVPKDPTRKLTLGRTALTQALRAVSPIARTSSMMVRFDVAPERTRIWAESRDAGVCEKWVTAALEGEPMNIAFNINYLQDFLGVVGSESVTLEMTTPSYPGLMKPKDEDPGFFYVVMPMTP
jgi:DNA polymerase III subunit beta